MPASDGRQAVPGRVRPGAGSSEGQDPPLCSGSSGEHCEGAGGRREADEAGTRWFRPSGGLPITAKGKASTHMQANTKVSLFQGEVCHSDQRRFKRTFHHLSN